VLMRSQPVSVRYPETAGKVAFVLAEPALGQSAHSLNFRISTHCW
jgi:hypothetical protein